MPTLDLKVIIGSTRPNRFSEQPAQWIFDKAKQRANLSVELLDLRDYPLPFFEEALPPGLAKDNYDHPTVTRWREKIKEADGYIVATPEYNHGYPAVLKNALDYTYFAWAKKAIAFVSWGGLGGGRAVEQLRGVAIELDMAPVRTAVHIPNFWMFLDDKGKFKSFDPYEPAGDALIDQLTWWAGALKAARQST
jgi:NAD(P)H-dependent FMN reductase